MKKLFSIALVVAMAMPLFAKDDADKTDATIKRIPREQSAIWPSPIAICQWPNSPDIIGLRLTIPFSSCHDSITGIDLGLWGRSIYFEGIQLNVLRNDVKDYAGGLQVGLYNSVGRGDLAGAQVGLWNETIGSDGLQFGLINVAGSVNGFQVGLINRAETLYGFQFGLINVIRDSDTPVMPIINIGY